MPSPDDTDVDAANDGDAEHVGEEGKEEEKNCEMR